MSLEAVAIAFEGGRCWLNPRVASGVLGAENSRHWPKACEEIWLAREQGETIKNDRRTHVRRVNASGRWWVVKVYSLPPMKHLFHRAFRTTPAWREWRGAERLRRAEMRCNPPLCLIEGETVGTGAQALIFPWVDGVTVARLVTMATPPNPRSERARRFDRLQARSLGAQMGTLFRAGILNRDGKVSNLVMDEECRRSGGALPPVIIDPSAIRRWRTRSQMHRALAVMWADARLVGRVPLREAVEFSRAVLLALGERTGPGCVRRLRNSVEPWVIQIEGRQRPVPPPRPIVEPHPADVP